MDCIVEITEKSLNGLWVRQAKPVAKDGVSTSE